MLKNIISYNIFQKIIIIILDIIMLALVVLVIIRQVSYISEFMNETIINSLSGTGTHLGKAVTYESIYGTIPGIKPFIPGTFVPIHNLIHFFTHTIYGLSLPTLTNNVIYGMLAAISVIGVTVRFLMWLYQPVPPILPPVPHALPNG